MPGEIFIGEVLKNLNVLTTVPNARLPFIRGSISEILSAKSGERDVYIADGIASLEMDTYDHTFSACLFKLGYENFAQLYELRRAAEQNNHWLDVMGGGYSSNRHYDSVTAIRLKDIDRIIESTASREQLSSIIVFKNRLLSEKASGIRKVIAGDVMDMRTWDQARKRLKTLKIGGFGVITCRPSGPFYSGRFTDQYTPEEYDLYLQGFYGIISNMLFLLDRKGVLFLQFPGDFVRSGRDFSNRINTIGGLKCHYGGELVHGGIAYAIERK